MDKNEVAELVSEAKRLQEEAQALREKSDKLTERAEELRKQISEVRKQKQSSIILGQPTISRIRGFTASPQIPDRNCVSPEFREFACE